MAAHRERYEARKKAARTDKAKSKAKEDYASNEEYVRSNIAQDFGVSAVQLDAIQNRGSVSSSSVKCPRLRIVVDSCAATIPNSRPWLDAA